jgi:phenylalanyl-tRNA synthetase beta chain
VRDLALVLNPPVSFKQIEALALQTERKILEEVSLFDVYEGKGLPEGKKSYGIRFLFRDSQKTLTDKQIDKSLQRIFNIFEKELQAQLR